MTKLKLESKLNKEVEDCINDIKKLKYSSEAKYKATRRFNDRIYESKKDKSKKKIVKKSKKKNVKKTSN